MASDAYSFLDNNVLDCESFATDAAHQVDEPARAAGAVIGGVIGAAAGTEYGVGGYTGEAGAVLGAEVGHDIAPGVVYGVDYSACWAVDHVIEGGQILDHYFFDNTSPPTDPSAYPDLGNANGLSSWGDGAAVNTSGASSGEQWAFAGPTVVQDSWDTTPPDHDLSASSTEYASSSLGNNSLTDMSAGITSWEDSTSTSGDSSVS